LKASSLEAALLVPFAGAARTRIISPELLEKLLIAVNNAIAAFDFRLAVESPSGVYSLVQKLKS
jgi:hypothetical protein